MLYTYSGAARSAFAPTVLALAQALALPLRRACPWAVKVEAFIILAVQNCVRYLFYEVLEAT